MKSNLNNEDVLLISKIKKVSKSIYTIYTHLKDLEVNNQKGTYEYNKYLDYLTIALEIEESLYCSIDNNVINALLYNLDDYIDDDFFCKFRVLRQLKNHRIIFDKEKDEIKYEFSNIKEKEHCLREIFFLQSFINNIADLNLKSKIIRFKYFSIYSEPLIEFDFICDSFDVNKIIYNISPVLINCLCIEEENKKSDVDKISYLEYLVSKAKKVSYCTIMENIKTILSKDDSFYNTPDGKLELITLQCNIRAHFLSLDEEMIAELNYIFHQIIEDKNYINKIQSNIIAEQAIVDCFKKVNEDKKKQHILQISKK